MKIIIALDSFKGSCSAQAACAAVARGLRKVDARLELVEMPVSDGGEGLLATLAESPLLSGVRRRRIGCVGPYGQPLQAEFLVLADGRGVIEMAQCCGLELTPTSGRDVRQASSYGLGQMVLAAMDCGCRHLIIGLGGSATNDGGLGFAQALGARFYRLDGTMIGEPGCSADLAQIAHADLSGLDPRLATITLQVPCDVTNPLLGINGATWVYARQKGADDTALVEMESGMANYAEVLSRITGRDIGETPGAGAAGGMGAALLWYADGQLLPGIGLVLSLLNAPTHFQHASLVIIGEGRLDRQSAFGKAPIGVAREAARYSVPAIALCGGRDEDSRSLYQHHVQAMWAICPRPMSLDESMAACETLLADTAENLLRTLKVGAGMTLV
ncbi:glycerate kinase [Sodalis ligni]|uniref:Glycerate kinase n=1 Tax=Sodalis ligni TaxID=2697027 RepID=A0A4R1N9S5_9GAMM|nr:glycerate kinase [Sodalis ligni]TCL03389.1 glycerate kinase [Sodalis ligni]